MSKFKVDDFVVWRAGLGVRFQKGMTVIETGLESPMETMPGEQVRVRLADGEVTRVWTEDIELASGGDGP